MHRTFLAGAMFCFMGIANAQSSWGLADLTNLKFILEDLNPGDGIEPALTYTFVLDRGSSTSARYIQTSPSSTLRNFTWGVGIAGPVSDTAIIDYSYATATVVGGDLWGAGAESHVYSYVWAMPSGKQNYSDAVATIGSPSSSGADFTLTPYTALTFTGWANTCAQASTSAYQEMATASVKLIYYGTSPQTQAVMNSAAGGAAHRSLDCNAGQLSVVVRNNSMTPKKFTLQALTTSATTTVLGGPI